MRKRKGRKKTGSGAVVAAVYNLLFSSRAYSSFRRFVAQQGALGCALICVVVLFAPGLLAKEKKKVTKTIAGVVLDAADNPLVGATVELNDIQADKKFAKYSQESGKYQFADLDPRHDYEVQASFKGMSSEVRRVSSLDDRRLVVVNFALTPQH